MAAHQTIYKNIGIGDENDWGSSIASNSTRLHVKTVTLNHDPTKEMVEDTMSSVKGRERMVRVRNVNEGDITGFVSPRTMHHMWELAMGVRGATSAVGSSAILRTYNQNTGGSMISKSINVDRNNTQETWNGVRGTALEVTGSDNKLEFTLNANVKTYSNNGTSMQDLVGETVKVATFADTTITIHQGASYGADITTLKVSEFSYKYENGLESAHLSGDRDIQRSDPGIPVVTGKFKIFHEGASFVNLAHGCSEAYIQFNTVYPLCAGLIAGVTPYTMRVDITRAELKSNVRNYEAAEKSVEEVEFEGKLNTGTSSLINVTQTVGFDIS